MLYWAISAVGRIGIMWLRAHLSWSCANAVCAIFVVTIPLLAVIGELQWFLSWCVFVGHVRWLLLKPPFLFLSAYIRCSTTCKCCLLCLICSFAFEIYVQEWNSMLLCGLGVYRLDILVMVYGLGVSRNTGLGCLYMRCQKPSHLNLFFLLWRGFWSIMFSNVIESGGSC